MLNEPEGREPGAVFFLGCPRRANQNQTALAVLDSSLFGLHDRQAQELALLVHRSAENSFLLKPRHNSSEIQQVGT